MLIHDISCKTPTGASRTSLLGQWCVLVQFCVIWKWDNGVLCLGIWDQDGMDEKMIGRSWGRVGPGGVWRGGGVVLSLRGT